MAKRNIFLISDATGETGEHFLRSVFTQFPKDSFKLTTFNFVSTPVEVDKIITKAKRDKAVIFHATIFGELKQRIREDCERSRLPFYDLTGPVMSFLLDATKLKPEWGLKKIHKLDTEYYSKIGALEFTINHDDGYGLSTLNEADIILTGVSRTSKTPTSMYLATKGYKVANVPLMLNVAPPKELLQIKEKKVVGLTIRPEGLRSIREKRAQAYQNKEGDYAELEKIKEEVRMAQTLFLKKRWPYVDVTNRAIEENGALVLKALKIKK